MFPHLRMQGYGYVKLGSRTFDFFVRTLRPLPLYKHLYIFGSQLPYPIDEETNREVYSEYHIPQGVYYSYMPKPTDHVFHMSAVPSG